MARYVQKGDIINYRNEGSDPVAPEQVVLLSGRIGVAASAIPAGETGALAISGVFEMPAETTAAFAVGQTLYWDASAGALTAAKPESGALLAGIAVEKKEQAGALALVRLGGV